MSPTPDLRYGRVPHSIYPLGKENALVSHPDSREETVLSLFEAKVFALCDGIKTLNGHQADIHVLFRASVSPAAIKVAIDRLIAVRLLRSEKEAMDMGAAVAAGSVPCRGSIEICLMTADRPEALGSLLRGLDGYLRRVDRTMTIRVFDDSGDQNNQRATRFAVGQFAAANSSKVTYTDREMRLASCKHLSRNLKLSAEVLAFVLGVPGGFRRSEGCNRNAALLSTDGSRSVTIDDDMMMRAVSGPSVTSQVTFSSRWNPSICTFYENLPTAIDANLKYEGDPVELHEAYLGTSPRSLLEQPVEPDYKDCSAELWNTVVRPNSSIKLTQMGILGDSGNSVQSWVLSGVGETIESRPMSDVEYALARRTRFVCRSTKSVTISNSSFCMSYALGIDQTELMPMFLPIGRNSDGIFGRMVRQLHPASCTAHLPLALVHAKNGSSVLDQDGIWRQASLIKESDLILALLGRVSLPQGIRCSAGQRLRMIGDHLIAVGAASPSQFEEILRYECWGIWSKRLTHYQNMMCLNKNGPKQWIQDLDNATRTLLHQASTGNLVIYDGSGMSILSDTSSRRLQKLIVVLGHSVLAWPEIKEYIKHSAISNTLSASL